MTIAIATFVVVSLVVLGGYLWKRESDRQARVAAEEARIVAYCNQLHETMFSFVTSIGVSDEGKDWARKTLAAAPADVRRDCTETLGLLEEAVSGDIDRRFSASSAWDCYDKGHAEAWRGTGGISIREWEDQLAQRCGVEGPIPGDKSAVPGQR